jgi:hypothetical protein
LEEISANYAHNPVKYVLTEVLLLRHTQIVGTSVIKQHHEKSLKVQTRVSFSNARHVLIFSQQC